jgi:hypothetical protein
MEDTAMATMTNPMELEVAKENHFLVVHPLDDVPETKVDTAALGPMPMTRSVRLSLMSLRAYLILMILLVVYHVMMLAR